MLLTLCLLKDVAASAHLHVVDLVPPERCGGIGRIVTGTMAVAPQRRKAVTEDTGRQYHSFAPPTRWADTIESLARFFASPNDNTFMLDTEASTKPPCVSDFSFYCYSGLVLHTSLCSPKNGTTKVKSEGLFLSLHPSRTRKLHPHIFFGKKAARNVLIHVAIE